MSDDKAYTATPAETLEQHIMDVNIAKSEAEWWANRTIEALRAENARLEKLNGMLHCSEAYDAMAKLCSETEWALNEKIEALRAENARLERLICRIYSAASNIDADKLSPGIIENIAAIVHANRNAMGENDE